MKPVMMGTRRTDMDTPVFVNRNAPDHYFLSNKVGIPSEKVNDAYHRIVEREIIKFDRLYHTPARENRPYTLIEKQNQAPTEDRYIRHLNQIKTQEQYNLPK